ncbi:MAG: SIS domain-containing protein [Deltaproteobacteria bacterium]|nr:SIS domain-containing protein [Deltaproteobacteria bacterium]
MKIPFLTRRLQRLKSNDRIFSRHAKGFRKLLAADVYIGKFIERVPHGSIVFFPCRQATFFCGIAGIVAFKNEKPAAGKLNLDSLEKLISQIAANGYQSCAPDNRLEHDYLGGQEKMETLWHKVHAFNADAPFFLIFSDKKAQGQIEQMAKRLDALTASESDLLTAQMGHLPAEHVDLIARAIEKLKDILWCLENDILANIVKIQNLLDHGFKNPSPANVSLFKKLNAVLNSIDRLEVRGRDSAGISIMFIFKAADFQKCQGTLKQVGHLDRFKERCDPDPLVNGGINYRSSTRADGKPQVAVAVTYKIALEIGRLGDNVDYLRRQIADDTVFQILATIPADFQTVSAHTRWASVGAITEANCHPVDSYTTGNASARCGIIHTCLNGDIDNFQRLKAEIEGSGIQIHSDITTDTKIIPLLIQQYVHQGHGIDEAFRLAVNDFEGSHAISMHTDLAPGKLYLAQRGSGQAIFVGIADEHYLASSEVYGFVEETPYYLKLDGEKAITGKQGRTQGQIFILDQTSKGGLDGIKACFYDGTPLELGESNLNYTEITTRDIDRQNFPHYFLKEISESPASVDKTLQNRWKFKEDDPSQYTIALDETIIPRSLQKALAADQIKRIFFIGQGTAGVAALACANILNYYLDNPSIQISALKASEFSGFQLNENDSHHSMTDTLIVAISQSGTTTDTNRTVDMVKERGAYTLAIVNRRDSDITFKVDGVMYTSSGRDIEMSVASTKAFYSQIVAGAVLGLYIARVKNRRDDAFVHQETQRLLALPSHMRKVLALREAIKRSAMKLAVTKTYWAAVGSGPNKAAADEIRIKLSELCYKTISSDFVEDKKHIDLSSEPLIIVCAAGSRSTVIGDIIKDTAIFKAHKATPVVIVNEGEDRFHPYAADVFQVPAVEEHLAPILNTLVGHIWGYYAALSINDGSRFLYRFQEDLQTSIKTHAAEGLTVYEIILEKAFQEKVAHFDKAFRTQKAKKQFSAAIGSDVTSDLTLLLKYLSGRLPVSDFELDFSQKGTAANMINATFACLGQAINFLARPVDAIKHQAKTVTVGTSRISERLEGILFDALSAENITVSQLTASNIIVLKNLQDIIRDTSGSILYRIEGLNLLGEPVKETTIDVVAKRGAANNVQSRVETDAQLKGTKRIIVRQGNVYIGKGRKDDRSITVIPVLSNSPSSPSIIENLLLLHIIFKDNIPLSAKIKALGGKYEHIQNIVQENSIIWNDQLLEGIAVEELFGRSAEKIGEHIVSQVNS